MKKILLVVVIAVFIFGLTACGGSNAESLANDMIKVTNNYTDALNNVKTKEDLISAMGVYAKSMTSITKKGQELAKSNPEAMKPMKNKEISKKIGEAMQNMMKAQMKPNIIKFMADPDVQKATKDMQKEIMKK
jgi:ABC-type phosphate/phosphonate transport system substrate-binding protein